MGKIVNELLYSEKPLTLGKIRLFTSNCKYDVSITRIMNNIDGDYKTGYELSEQIPEGDIFIYGYEVEDFKTLNYELINVNLLAAVKKLSEKVDYLEKLLINNSSRHL